MATVIGTTIVIGAAGILVFLTLWARKRIESLAEQGYPSTRDVDREGEDVRK